MVLEVPLGAYSREPAFLATKRRGGSKDIGMRRGGSIVMPASLHMRFSMLIGTDTGINNRLRKFSSKDTYSKILSRTLDTLGSALLFPLELGKRAGRPGVSERLKTKNINIIPPSRTHGELFCEYGNNRERLSWSRRISKTFDVFALYVYV